MNDDFLLIDAASNGELEQKGNSALLAAAMNGHFEIVSLLIDKGAWINHQNENGSTALHVTSICHFISIVSLLIEKGADLNIKNINGDTPLMISAFHGHARIVSLLLHNGAGASLMNNNGLTALDIARRRKKPDCVAILQNYEHFRRYRKVWLSFTTSLSSYREEQEKDQETNQIQVTSLMRVMDSSDLVRYVTEYM